MEGEIGVMKVEKRIRSRVKRQMEKTQREYYLNEQMKAIQKELGETEDGHNELTEIEERAAKVKMTKEAKEKFDAELKKLKMMSPMSAEATVIRNYLDVMLSLPWRKYSKVKKDLQARRDDPERRPLRPGKGKRAHPRILGGAEPGARPEGADSVSWWAHRAWARRRWASPSRGPPTATSCASRWAACGMRAKSGATAGRTSAPCRARSCSR